MKSNISSKYKSMKKHLFIIKTYMDKEQQKSAQFKTPHQIPRPYPYARYVDLPTIHKQCDLTSLRIIKVVLHRN